MNAPPNPSEDVGAPRYLDLDARILPCSSLPGFQRRCLDGGARSRPTHEPLPRLPSASSWGHQGFSSFCTTPLLGERHESKNEEVGCVSSIWENAPKGSFGDTFGWVGVMQAWHLGKAMELLHVDGWVVAGGATRALGVV